MTKPHAEGHYWCLDASEWASRSTFKAPAESGSSSQMESVPPCQGMSDGLPARWTPPCQSPFTSYGCPLICLMTNDYPGKRPGRPTQDPHVWIRGTFTCCTGGPTEQPSPHTHTQLSLLSCCRGGGGGGGGEVSEETATDWEREVRHGASADTVTGPLLHDDTLPDLSEGCPAHVISLSRISQKVLWEAICV